MRGHRKRSNGYWMPTLGTVYNNGANHYHSTTNRIDFIQPQIDNSLAAIQNVDLAVLPLVPDFTPTPDDNSTTLTNTLNDLVRGQEWFCDRIVGKLHLSCLGGATGSAAIVWPNILVKAGFFVARSIDEAPVNIDLQTAEYDPLEENNVMNPWIWQRSWMFANAAATAITGGPALQWPTNNAQYGSLADGPHIDIKTKRRIHKEERLWFVIKCTGFENSNTVVTGTQANQARICGLLDLRIHGAMRNAHNTSRF